MSFMMPVHHLINSRKAHSSSSWFPKLVPILVWCTVLTKKQQSRVVVWHRTPNSILRKQSVTRHLWEVMSHVVRKRASHYAACMGEVARCPIRVWDKENKQPAIDMLSGIDTTHPPWFLHAYLSYHIIPTTKNLA